MAAHPPEGYGLTMPIFTDTSSGYVQWQSARRKAKQVAQEAAIDIIEHYNRLTLNGGKSNRQGPNHHISDGVKSFDEEDSQRTDMTGNTEKPTLRGHGHKTNEPRSYSLERHAGVFTEDISSLSRRSQPPLSLKGTDIVSENLPDNMKITKGKDRIHVALSQPSSRQSRGSYRSANKGNVNSARSVRTLPPPSSYPLSEMLSLTELTRAKTFTLDDRVEVCTRPALDSRQTDIETQPVKDKKVTDRHGTQFSMYYPSITGAPPNTPLNMPLTWRHKVPSVNVVSLGGETVENITKKYDSRPRLPVSFRGLSQDLGPPRGKGNMGTMTSFKTSCKPGIDLPHLPLRYANAKDASFQFTPRERPGRMNYNAYNRSRRRAGVRLLKQNTTIKFDTSAQVDRRGEPKSKITTNDPYANRFRQVSSVMSVGDIPPPASASYHQPASDNEHEDKIVPPEPAVMLTVQEEEGENNEDDSRAEINVTVQSEEATKDTEKQTEMDELSQAPISDRVKNRAQSLVSNASLLSVPFRTKDLSEARPPNDAVDIDDAGPIAIDIPILPGGQSKIEIDEISYLHSEPEAEDPASSPPIASTSVINTARTIATQTSLPFDPDVSHNRPTVKIKTLSMFPDINTSADGLNGAGSQIPKSNTSEPLLKMSHGDKYSDTKVLSLPELCGGQSEDLSEEERSGGAKWKSNGVQNITFISPLEVHQNAKRF